MMFDVYLLIFFIFLVLYANSQWLIRNMKKSPHEDYKKLAEISLSLENDWDWVKTNSLIDNGVMRHGTHAFNSPNEKILKEYLHLEEKHDTVWYRSAEAIMSENPHLNWISKKKWPLCEQLYLHIMNYQEV